MQTYAKFEAGCGSLSVSASSDIDLMFYIELLHAFSKQSSDFYRLSVDKYPALFLETFILALPGEIIRTVLSKLALTIGY